MQSLQSWVSKVLRKLQKRLKKFVPKKPKQKKRLLVWNRSLIIIVLGILLVIFGGYKYYRTRVLSFNSPPTETQKAVQNVDYPIEIIIPSINIDLKIDPGQIVNGVWQTSATNATYLASSAAPGEPGNTVIYAHNKKTTFGNLPYLSMGQQISIKTKSGKIYKYTATEKYFVKPDRIDLVSPSNKEEITIYTCWGVFDSERVVIKAFPIK